MIEDRKAALASLQEKMEGLVTAIGLSKNILMLVDALATQEAEKSQLLIEIAKLQQRETLRGSDSDVDERIKQVIGLLPLICWKI